MAPLTRAKAPGLFFWSATSLQELAWRMRIRLCGPRAHAVCTIVWTHSLSGELSSLNRANVLLYHRGRGRAPVRPPRVGTPRGVAGIVCMREERAWERARRAARVVQRAGEEQAEGARVLELVEGGDGVDQVET